MVKYMRKRIDIFLIITVTFFIIAYVYIWMSHGEAMKYLVWNGESVGIFPDLFESIKDSYDGKPYDGNSIYPAFAYFICWIISRFTPGDTKEWSTFSLSGNGNIVGFLFFFLCTFFIYYIVREKFDKYGKKLEILFLLWILSPGYIYCIERGNMVILSTLFLLLFLTQYNSQKKYMQEIAIVMLACAACMKIYPAIFGLILLIEKKYWSSLRAIFYGIFFFVVPFGFFGGYAKIAKMVKNIINLSSETGIDERGFGYGFKINIDNIVAIVCNWLGVGNVETKILSQKMMFLIVILVLIFLFLAKAQWHKIFLITVILTLVPGFSWIYNAVYFFLPLVFFLIDETEINRKILYIYEIGFWAIITPFPYGFLFNSLHGVNKVSISTVMNFVGAIIILCGIIFETIKNKKHSESMLNKL